MSIQRRDGAETRGKLLAAAGVLFAAKGFHDTRTADICRRAQANIAAIHYHFRSKEHLYVEAWRHAFERSIAAYPPDGGVPAGAPAEERLRGQIRALIRRIMDPNSIDFDIATQEMTTPTGLLAEAMHRSIEPLYRRFTDSVRELLGRRASEQQVQLCAMSVNAQCHSPLLHERHRRMWPPDSRPPGPTALKVGAEALADHIFRFSLAGLRGVGKPARCRRGKKSKRKVAA